jgi:hypothetical protein
VFPSLVLNYAGQAALVLNGEPTSDNIFYRLCPSALLIPLVVLATVATIIASQSIITGAFSMTRQAIQLGWLPRLQITQTSAEGYGQIYVGIVNWLLMIVTVGLTIGFRKSDNLAAAYGIAVSATMLMTSALLFIAMREVWQWSLLTAGAVAGAWVREHAAPASASPHASAVRTLMTRRRRSRRAALEGVADARRQRDGRRIRVVRVVRFDDRMIAVHREGEGDVRIGARLAGLRVVDELYQGGTARGDVRQIGFHRVRRAVDCDGLVRRSRIDVELADIIHLGDKTKAWYAACRARQHDARTHLFDRQIGFLEGQLGLRIGK